MEDFRFDDEINFNEAEQNPTDKDAPKKRPENYADFLMFRAVTAAVVLAALLFCRFVFPDFFKTVRGYYEKSFSQNITAESLLNEGGEGKK